VGKEPQDLDFNAFALRRAAEEFAAGLPVLEPTVNGWDQKRILHELQVHEIELKMQNEELSDAYLAREAALEDYTNLFDFAPIGYFKFNRSGEIILVNFAGARFFRMERFHLCRRRFALFLASVERKRFSDFLDAIFCSVEKQFCELQIEFGDRTRQFVRLEGIESSGEDECLVAMIDLTDQRKSDESLRLQDRAMHAVPQGISITDPRQPGCPIIYVNDGFERITGYSRAEMLGKDCSFLQGKDTDRVAVARLRDAIGAGESCSVELLIYRKDGSPFWNAMLINPVRDESGRLINFVEVSMDVTGQRNREELLRQAQKMEAVGQLAGGIAHDFNNILTVIDGYAGLLLHRMPSSDPSCELLQEIRSASAHATYLTRQLLTFSRRQALCPESLDLNAMIVESMTLLKRLIGTDVVIETFLEPKLHRVWAERGQISQILMNLVINARDAIQGDGKIRIETTNVELGDVSHQNDSVIPTDGYAMMVVADSGSGMSEEVCARIFEPFFTTKPVGSGTGIGLATVQDVVARTGGYIEVASELGVGTTFKVYLPQLRSSVPMVEDLAQASVQAPASESLQGCGTILLLEDDDSVRRFTETVLMENGYTVLSAPDGNHAIRIAEDDSLTIDLLISDVVVPGVSGPDVAERIRRLRPDIRVLLMSGYLSQPQSSQKYLEGDAKFIQKPFSMHDLLWKTKSTLERRSDS